MAWLYLAAAAVFEVIFALSMKASDGFTRPLATGVTVIAVIGGIVCLTLAMRSIPVSLAYPIWTATGAVGTVLLGFALFGESLNVLKIVGVAAIVAGVATLRASA